jgi:hypothetical protein
MTIQDRSFFLRFESIDQIVLNGQLIEAVEVKITLKREGASSEDRTAGIIYHCGNSEFVLT